jgi:hypothetical protein
VLCLKILEVLVLHSLILTLKRFDVYVAFGFSGEAQSFFPLKQKGERSDFLLH